MFAISRNGDALARVGDQRRLLEVPKRATAAIHRLFYLTHSHIPTMEVASVLSPATRDATDGIGAFLVTSPNEITWKVLSYWRGGLDL